ALLAVRTSFVLLDVRPPPPSTLFPYTTLFRSRCAGWRAAAAAGRPPLGAAAALRSGPGGAEPEALRRRRLCGRRRHPVTTGGGRSEEHTSELQSRENLVCRLLLEKKNDR